MANTKLKSIQIKQRTQLTDRPKTKAKTKIRTKTKMIRPKISFKAVDIKQPKIISKLRPQAVHLKLKRRSLLMRKAMQPLLPPQGKSKQKAKVGLTKRKQLKVKSSTNATIVIVKNSEHRSNQLLSLAQKRRVSSANNQLPKQKTSYQKPARIPAGAEDGYNKGQQIKVPRRQPNLMPPPPSPQSLLPHLGSGIQKEAYGTFSYKGAQPPRPIQKNEELVVPLSSRLPIIDFISTDEFERLHSFRMKHRKRFTIDGKPGDNLRTKKF